MKIPLVVLLVLLFSAASNAGIVGWFTSEARDWQFIQHSGGIRIGTPLEKGGRKVLPVDYWPEGNSGLAVRKIEFKKNGTKIAIRVITQLVEKGSDTARTHYVDLSSVPAGSYEVYYEKMDDPAKLLGRFDIK